MFAEIVGGRFRPTECQAQKGRLKEGDLVTLQREPTNKYDARAVAVYSQNLHIGYIPKRANNELAAEMDAGEIFVAKVDQVLGEDVILHIYNVE